MSAYRGSLSDSILPYMAITALRSRRRVEGEGSQSQRCMRPGAGGAHSNIYTIYTSPASPRAASAACQRRPPAQLASASLHRSSCGRDTGADPSPPHSHSRFSPSSLVRPHAPPHSFSIASRIASLTTSSRLSFPLAVAILERLGRQSEARGQNAFARVRAVDFSRGGQVLLVDERLGMFGGLGSAGRSARLGQR